MSTYLIKDADGSVINTIVADEAFVEAHYPGRCELVPELTPVPPPPAVPAIDWPSMGVPTPIEITSATPFFTGD